MDRSIGMCKRIEATTTLYSIVKVKCNTDFLQIP